MQKIRFFSNKEFDKYMALQFLDTKAAGVDFGQGIVRVHPHLGKAKRSENVSERKKIVNAYFDEFYRGHKQELRESVIFFRREWRKKEKDFFNISKSLFDGFEFKQGMNICYLSILDCNPRFLESKTFQMYYKKNVNEAIHTIVHECLHFIFFDFVDSKFAEQSKMISDEAMWDLSEIFNVVVLSSERFSNLIKREVIKPYPAHKKHLPLFFETYKQSSGVEDFIKKGIEIMKKERM